MAEFKNWEILAGCAETAQKQLQKEYSFNPSDELQERITMAKHKAQLYRDRADTISDYLKHQNHGCVD